MSVEAANSAAAAQATQVQAQAAGVQQPKVDTQSPREAARNTVEAVEATVDKLQRATQKLNELMASGQRSLNFSVDKNSNQVVVKVVDKNTQETVRQIPGPEAMKLAENLEQMIGVIFNRSI